MTGDGTDHLGFAGLLDAGYTPRQAWQIIRDDLAAHPDACAVFTTMASDPQGRAALDWVRGQWARHGLPAPFDELPRPDEGDPRT